MLALAKNFFLWEVFARAEREHGAGLLALNCLSALHFAWHAAMAETHKDSGGCLPPLIGIKAIGRRLHSLYASQIQLAEGEKGDITDAEVLSGPGDPCRRQPWKR